MMENEDDETLIRTCLAGDPASFGVLVTRHQDRLYATLLRLTGHREDALELLQETFLRAYSLLSRFRGGSQFYTWIYRIAVNLAITERRRRRSSAARVIAPRTLSFDPPDESSEVLPLDILEKDETQAEIQKALDALHDDHRAVVVMKEYDGLRYEEIAQILGIPIGTVRSRLYRARAELRVLLRHLIQDEPELRSVNAFRD